MSDRPPRRGVGNNVTQGFDLLPFAVGQAAPGDLTDRKINEDADIVSSGGSQRAGDTIDASPTNVETK